MNNLIIILTLPLFLLLRLFIMNFLPLSRVVAEPILFFDLINKPLLISSFFGIFAGTINILLIGLISKKIIGSKIWFIPAFIYAVSPWSIYLEVGGSLYIPILTCLLAIFIGLKGDLNNRQNLVLFILASGVAVYTSILMWLALPLLIFSIFKLRFIKLSYLKIYFLGLIVICLPLFFATFRNLSGIKNIFSNQMSIFSEVGLINAVNVFRGEASKTKFVILSKFVENRYFYLSEHVIFNILKHFSPVTYFTSEFKMFSFSFSPPILLGFLLPFLFGLKYFFQICIKNKWLFLVVAALILPSVLSKNSPDLNRLVLLAPGIFLLIGVGFKELLSEKTFIFKLLLFATFILIYIQIPTFISDIYLRENIRLHQTQKKL